MDEKNIQSSLPHNLILEERKKLTVSSVNEVGSFDEHSIIALISSGELSIYGENLHISKFSTDDGELVVEGSINSVNYSDNAQNKSGFFSKIFR